MPPTREPAKAPTSAAAAGAGARVTPRLAGGTATWLRFPPRAFKTKAEAVMDERC